MQNPFGKSAISMCDRLRNSFVVLQYSNNSATRLVQQIYVASITISTKNQQQQQQPTTKAMKWHVECIKLPFIWFLFSPLPRHCPTFYCCRLYICVLLPSFGSDLLLFFAVAYFWEHLNNVYICTPWICIVFWYLSKVLRVVSVCQGFKMNHAAPEDFLWAGEAGACRQNQSALLHWYKNLHTFIFN